MKFLHNIGKPNHYLPFPPPFFRLLAILLCLTLITACKSRQMQQHENMPEGSLSPGPSGGLFEDDYRIPVIWLQNYGSNYGPGDYARMLSFGGRQRFYEVHVPPQYTSSAALPVILVLHGGGGNTGVVRFESRMNEVSDAHGFIVVYPAGTGTSGFDRKLNWNSGPLSKEPTQRNVDDVGFINYVLNDLEKFFSVDDNRVYSTGLSNGAQMSFRLAAELSNRIAAVAPVSGDRTIGMFFSAPKRPMPVLYFHGMEDTFLPFNGGPVKMSAFEEVPRPPVPETVLGWVKQAGADPARVEKTQTGHAICYHYPPASPQGVEVDFWVLEDGGHTWPGGRASRVERLLGVGNIDQDIFASEIMWEFLKRYKLPK